MVLLLSEYINDDEEEEEEEKNSIWRQERRVSQRNCLVEMMERSRRRECGRSEGR